MPRPFCPNQLGPPWPTFSSINDFWSIFEHQDASTKNYSISFQEMKLTCSEETLFVWVPSLLLGILTALEMNHLVHNHKTQNGNENGNRNSKHQTAFKKAMPVTTFFIAKILSTCLIIILLMSRLIYWLLYADHALNQIDTAYGENIEWSDSSAPIIADGVRLMSFVLIAYIMLLHRRYHQHSSMAIFIYLSLSVIPNIYTLLTLMVSKLFTTTSPTTTAIETHSQLYFLESPFTVLNQPFMVATKLLLIFATGFLFIIYCFSDHDATVQIGKNHFGVSTVGKHPTFNNPELTASVFSRLTFAWFTALILKARRVVALQQEHLWMLAGGNTANSVISPFERLYGKRMKENRVHKKRINVVSLLFFNYWPHLVVIGLLKLIASLFIFVNPIVLDWIIAFMDTSPVDENGHPRTLEPAWRGLFYCSLMFFSPLFESFFTSQYEYHINTVTMRMKTCLTAVIYRKALRLSNASKQTFTTGEIVNFIAVDLQRIVDFFNNLNTVWSSPVQIAIGVYLLYLQLNVAAFAGFSIMLVIIPINLWLTNIVKRIQMRMMTEKDKRAKLMDEILNGVKVVKLNSWEDIFEQKVMEIREKEMAHLKRFAYVNTLINSLFSGSAFLVGLFSFTTFAMISPNNVLNANRAFVSLALFNIIRIPLSFLPILLSYAGVAIVSIRRINEYLNAPELDENSITHFSDREPTPKLTSKSPKSSKTVIKIIDGTFTWLPEEDDQATLHQITVEIKQGQLIAIVGSVGAGKSSFLSAFLGDMIKLNGNVELHGSIAYVPQEAWIRNATIRENIILDKAFDETKYRQVLESCALTLDLAMFPAGDLTEVGEKGINLSGGQKQRISLARAVYSEADTYLFDDPLSAVDAHVSKHIFEKVIGPSGCLASRTRLLVTHKLSLLPNVDAIIYIERGQIGEPICSFAELIASKGPFSQYVAEYFLDRLQDASAGNVVERDHHLDEEDLQFMSSVEPAIKHVIEKLEFSRSTSIQKQQSIESGGGRKISQISRQRSMIRSGTSSSMTVSRSSDRQVSGGRGGSQAPPLKFTTGKLTATEGMAEGAVDLSNHRKYFATIGYLMCAAILLALALSNVFQVFGSLWLSEWSNDALNPQLIGSVNSEAAIEWRNRRVTVYAILGIFETTFAYFGTLGIYLMTVKAAKVLHNRMLSGVLRAPMSFFDTTPMGRIMNRFSRDIDVIDLQICLNLRLLSMQIFRTIVAFGLISLETPIILSLLIPLALIYYGVQRLYINTSRQLKRIEAVTRSPINNLLSETVSGATSIRTYSLVERFVREIRRKIDENNQSYWLNFTASRWLAIRLEFLSYTIVFVSTVFAVVSRGTLSPGVAGLAISYSLNITSILNIFIRGYTDLETNFVSVERVIEYTEVEKEKDADLPQSKMTRPPPGWPSSGTVSFRGYSTQYRPGLPLVLNRLSLDIASGKKVAVVGRTGSGKSSLALALFRILNAVEGKILIDGIDISTFHQRFLRQSLTIVAQDPVLFTGTLRSNVDIYGVHSDEAVIEALRQVNLEQFLETIDHNLEYPISSGSAAESLSAGQRQLICLARALINERKVIVLDEATAVVDYETEQSIHDVIFSPRFLSVTVLMIAHRLDGILDYDQVLVMRNGTVAEFDDPKKLAEDIKSDFYAMAKEAKII